MFFTRVMVFRLDSTCFEFYHQYNYGKVLAVWQILSICHSNLHKNSPKCRIVGPNRITAKMIGLQQSTLKSFITLFLMTHNNPYFLFSHTYIFYMYIYICISEIPPMGLAKRGPMRLNVSVVDGIPRPCESNL